MVEAMKLKLWHRGHLQGHDIPAQFHENMQIILKVIRGTQTDRQTGDILSPPLIFRGK